MKFRLLINREAEEEVTASVHKRSEFTDRLENMVLEYSGEDRLPAYREDEMKRLSLEDIECITVLEGKTWALDREGRRYRLRFRLRELEDRLPRNFIRINKSSIANRDRIEKLTAAFSGAVDAVFRCGWSDYVSRRCLTELKRSLGLK